MKKAKIVLSVIILLAISTGVFNGFLIKKRENPVLTIKFYNNDYVTHVGLLYYLKSDTNDYPDIKFGNNNNIEVGIWFLPSIDFANKTILTNNLKQ